MEKLTKFQMLLNTIFNTKIPILDINQPLILTYLKNWILIKVSGSDVVQYLHNQLTCDIKNLSKHHYHFSAYCNNKGKMISNMYVFYYKNEKIAFIEPFNIHKNQILIMQKYALFSNIIINPDNDIILIGISGLNSKQYLNMFFNTLPNQTNTIIHYSNISLLYFPLPTERFLLIINNKSLLIELLHQSQSFSTKYHDYNQWTALDIQSGYPYISNKTSEMFFPQSANMDKLKGISFNKGCYLGQELIARIQYHKLNKQSLCKLSGYLINWNETNQFPTAGDHIELQINEEYWKNIGTILQSCQIKKNHIWIQAILNKSIEKHNISCIRILKTHNKTHLYININNIEKYF